MSLVCSEVDQRFFEKVAPGRRVVVIPNNVDTEAFRPASADRAENRLIFTGTLWYEPNTDAVRWLVREIFPLLRNDFPDMELQIVGDSPPKDIQEFSRRPGVTVKGSVADIRPWLAGAAVFVAPIRMGSGTRQKILDAMAMGLPIVATAAACEGIDVKDGETVCFAETPAEFRENMGRLVRDPGFRARLAEQARRLVEEKYSRRVSVEKVSSLWRDVEAEIRNHDRAERRHC